MGEKNSDAERLESGFRGAYAIVWLLCFLGILGWTVWANWHHAESGWLGLGLILLGLVAAGLSMIFLGGLISLTLRPLFRSSSGSDGQNS